MGLSSALINAGQALEVFSAGMQVAGNNIANSTTPGYVREVLQTAPSPTVAQGNVLIGGGVTATGVRQQINTFLQQQIQNATSDYQGALQQSNVYQQLETTMQALGGSSLSSQLNSFLGNISNVVNQPESTAQRNIAVQAGVQLAQGITSIRSQIDSQRTALDQQVSSLVSQANGLLDNISQLNSQIAAAEHSGQSGSDDGAARSQRYNDLTQLAQIIPIRTAQDNGGQIDVYTGSEHLVDGSGVQHLQTVTGSSHGMTVQNVVIQNSNMPISGSGGQLNGAIAGRDTILGGFVDNLDALTSNLIYQFNNVYSSGQGLHGYSSVTATNSVTSPTAALNAAGLPFTPTNGGFQVQVVNTTTGATQTTSIPVNLSGIGTATSLTSLAASLNSVANLSASISPAGQLTISAASGYQVEFSNDTSGTLASLGINTFFTGSNSSNIGVNAALAADPGLFAAAQGGGPGDGTNAAQLSQINTTPVAGLNGASLSDYYNGTVATISQAAASESALSTGNQGYLNALTNQQAQTSGVSIDAEAVQVMQYQHSYQAAARIISTLDQLFTTLMHL